MKQNNYKTKNFTKIFPSFDIAGMHWYILYTFLKTEENYSKFEFC